MNTPAGNWDASCLERVMLRKHYAMKAYGGVDIWIHMFLIPALIEGEWPASCLGRFTPE
jgi:hypothetical protein